MPVTEEKDVKKPLSESPLGYVFAVLGGLPAFPIGLLASPGVLFLLNKIMKEKEGKRPNRFAVWALIGIIGAPISSAIGIGALIVFDIAITPPQAPRLTGVHGSSSGGSTPPKEQEVDPPVTSVTSGDFTLSKVKIKPYSGDTKGADVAGELWVVYASVTNNSKETKVPSFNVATEVRDSEGRTFEAADFVVTSNSIVDETFGGAKVTRFTDGVLPGSTRDNVQVGVFDVTKGAKGLQLCVGGLFSGKKCING